MQTVRLCSSRQPIDDIAVPAESDAAAVFVGSALAGDTWDGTLGRFDVSAAAAVAAGCGDGDDVVPTCELPCGCSAVEWLERGVVVLGCDDGTVSVVRLCDDGSVESLCEDAVHDNMVVALAVDPCTRAVASGGHDGAVRVWEAADAPSAHRMPLRAVYERAHECHGVCWAAGGSAVGAGYSDGALRLYDARTPGGCVSRTRASGVALTAVCSSDGDGTMVAVGDDAGVVRVFDARELARPLWGARRHAWACTALALKRFDDGRTVLASGGEDCCVVVGDTAQAAEAQTAKSKAHSDAVSTLVWCGQSGLLSASRDRTVVRHSLASTC